MWIRHINNSRAKLRLLTQNDSLNILSHFFSKGFKRPFVTYGIALLVPLAALFISHIAPGAKDSALGTYIVFFIGVASVALLAGLGPGAVATAGSALAIDYWIITPHNVFAIADPADAMGMAIFLSVGLSVSIACELYRAHTPATTLQPQPQLDTDEQHFRTMVNAIPQLVWVASIEGHVTWLNQRCYHYTGLTFDQLKGSGWRAIVDPQVLPELLERWTNSLRSGKPFEMVTPLRGADGNYRTFLSRVAPLHDSDGHVVEWFGSGTDITERVRAEETLRLSEEMFAKAFYGNSAAMCITSLRDGRIIDVNETFQKLLGASRNELVGKTSTEVMIWKPGERDRALGDLQAKRRRNLEVQFSTRTGEHKDILLSGEIIEVRGEAAILSFLLDVTENKRAEEALRRSEERFRIAQELSLVAFTLLSAVRDDNGKIVDFRWEYLNPAAGKILRRPPEELIGRRLLDVLPGNKSESDLFDTYVRVVETGMPSEYELHYQSDSIDGWFRNMTVKLGDGIAVSFEDNSDKKRAEIDLRVAKDAAEMANAAKSQFLSNVSHELRTPMSSIIGMTELALDETLSHEVREYLETVKTSADSLLCLLNQLLDFSRVESGKMKLENAPFKLGHLITDTVRALAVTAEQKGLDLKIIESEILSRVLIGDSLALRQVITNLMGNAIKFTEAGRVTLHVVQESLFGDRLKLRFEIEDTGPGISEKDREHIFQPFVQVDSSFSRRYPGTGLGLPISSSLVKLMEGEIGVKSEVGKGSTFYFTATFGVPTSVPANKYSINKAPFDGRPLRILIAEDTPSNQKLLEAILTKRGHATKIANNGSEAIKMLADEDFDLVLMDVQMPSLDGYSATKQVRALTDTRKARLPIIAMTAHAMKQDEERCLASGMDAYVSKPINSHELVALIERLANQQC